MKTLFPVIAYIFMSVFEVLADILGKKWAIGDGATFLLFAMGLYSMSGLLFIISLKYYELSTASIMLAAVNMFVAITAGIMLFGESMNMLKIIAITLLVAAFSIQLIESLQG